MLFWVFVLFIDIISAFYLGQKWESLHTAERSGSPKCVPIPSNLTLCHGIQYDTMRLPNLLEHETMDEVLHQSDAWNSLLRLHCHPDTRLFLCSLFAPVCVPDMDKHIYPCNSLCLDVKTGCESRMAQYGFPWPEMLRCDRFPNDNDMCIKKPDESERHSQTSPPAIAAITQPTTTTTTTTTTQTPTTILNSETKRACRSCAQIPTFENILDHYCRSTVVVKAKIHSLNSTHFTMHRIQRVFKSDVKTPSLKTTGKTLQISDSSLPENDCQCQFPSDNRQSNNFLVMSGGPETQGGTAHARLVLPWHQNNKGFKAAIRKFRKTDCSKLGREIRDSVMKQNLHRSWEP